MNERLALVLGGASCVWDDVDALERMYGQPWDGVVVIANDIGAHWPRQFQHWVTFHPNKLKKWRTLRAELGQPACEITTWGPPLRYDSDPVLTDRIEPPWALGSSGLFALQVARVIGCDRAVLCGIPMTDTAHFEQSREPLGQRWAQANAHWRAWTRNAHLFTGWARSMSGRTRELLGEPSLAWLCELSQVKAV